jgi:HrpA-like RNA helicase
LQAAGEEPGTGSLHLFVEHIDIADHRFALCGRVIVIHLLAPNQRAVQTTTDLAGFWERLYPQIRQELIRRYPKHAWPERPQVQQDATKS